MNRSSSGRKKTTTSGSGSVSKGSKVKTNGPVGRYRGRIGIKK